MKIHFIVISFILIFGSRSVTAQLSKVTLKAVNLPPQTNVVKVPNQPLTIQRTDGTEIEIVAKVTPKILTTDFRLSENTCSEVRAAKCKGQFPYFEYRFRGVWKKHPSKTGQFVRAKSSSDKDGSVIAVDQTDFNIISASGSMDDTHSDFGEFVCDRYDFLPWQSLDSGKQLKVAFWDDDFERPITQLSYYAEGSSPSFNAFIARYENIPFYLRDSKILVGPAEDFLSGRGRLLFFPLAYRVQFTIDSPNIENPRDQMCIVKMDIDFNNVFVAFNETFGDIRKYLPSEFSPVLVGSELENKVPKIFMENVWQQELL